jgi:hypothetical protein
MLITRSGGIFKNGKAVKEFLDKDGYLKFKLNGKSVFSHRTIVEFFFGKIEKGMVVNHKNGIKTDNRIDNLEAITQKENVIHAWKNGLCTSKKGSSHGRSKLDEVKVLAIITMPLATKKDNRFSNYNLSKIFNVSTTRISAIRNKREWKHVHSSLEK